MIEIVKFVIRMIIGIPIFILFWPWKVGRWAFNYREDDMSSIGIVLVNILWIIFLMILLAMRLAS